MAGPRVACPWVCREVVPLAQLPDIDTNVVLGAVVVTSASDALREQRLLIRCTS